MVGTKCTKSQFKGSWHSRGEKMETGAYNTPTEALLQSDSMQNVIWTHER